MNWTVVVVAQSVGSELRRGVLVVGEGANTPAEVPLSKVTTPQTLTCCDDLASRAGVILPRLKAA